MDRGDASCACREGVVLIAPSFQRWTVWDSPRYGLSNSGRGVVPLDEQNCSRAVAEPFVLPRLSKPATVGAGAHAPHPPDVPLTRARG